MNRRSVDIQGYVKFPLDLPNSNEGGMFVRLVVVEEKHRTWMVCCGGDQQILMDECLCGDDVHPDPITSELSDVPSQEQIEAWLEESHKKPAWDFHFPHYRDEDAARTIICWREKYLSTPYLAVLTLGSTGWSGTWKCTYDDLTDKGKALYDQVKALYGDQCQLYLQTWLDT